MKSCLTTLTVCLALATIACSSPAPRPIGPTLPPAITPTPRPVPPTATPRGVVDQAALAYDPALLTRNADAWKGLPIRLRGRVHQTMRDATGSGFILWLIPVGAHDDSQRVQVLASMESPNPPETLSCIEADGVVGGSSKDAFQKDASSFATVRLTGWRYADAQATLSSTGCTLAPM